MSSFYLNSYVPLATNPVGRANSERHGIPPFVDGSIRREPDLEHAFPSISCLCRGGSFAPRLEVGDVVAYMTSKGSYGQRRAQRRLTAVLQVIAKFPTHTLGAAWYREQGLPLPCNCMVRGNPCKPMSHSHGRSSGEPSGCGKPTVKDWDKAYRGRMMKWRTFLVCKPLFVDVSWNAPEVTEMDLAAIYGRIPGTLNPGRDDIRIGQALLDQLKLNITIDSV